MAFKTQYEIPLICFSLIFVSLFSCNNSFKKKSLNITTETQKQQETEAKALLGVKDLKFEPVKIIKAGFNKSNNLQEVFYGLSKDSIHIVFTSDTPIGFLNIVEERSGKVVKQFRYIYIKLIQFLRYFTTILLP